MRKNAEGAANSRPRTHNTGQDGIDYGANIECSYVHTSQRSLHIYYIHMAQEKYKFTCQAYWLAVSLFLHDSNRLLIHLLFISSSRLPFLLRISQPSVPPFYRANSSSTNRSHISKHKTTLSWNGLRPRWRHRSRTYHLDCGETTRRRKQLICTTGRNRPQEMRLTDRRVATTG